MSDPRPDALGTDQIESFIEDGFVRIDGAFPTRCAEDACAILWKATGYDPTDSNTWAEPVVRLGQLHLPPFVEAANTPVLRRAFDQLVGAGRWLPLHGLGTFPLRFPSERAPGDDGWHIDMSYGQENPDFMEWKANIYSKGRGLLMLFLFSDVGPEDAPTRIRIGSHRGIARTLAPAGEAGLTLRELSADGFAESEANPEALAVGRAGTVYLCHPFLVHSAQRHRGQTPRFMAQPPILLREPISLNRTDGDYSPVELAIVRALEPA